MYISLLYQTRHSPILRWYDLNRVPTSSGNHGKPWKSLKKIHAWKKSWNLKKNWIIMEKTWNLWNNLTKPPVARKLAVGHSHVRQLVFWLLVVSSFNYFKIHTWSTCMLLLLHSAFMLSKVKMRLKLEAGGRALNSHWIRLLIMENHGKIMELCFWISVRTLFKYCWKWH